MLNNISKSEFETKQSGSGLMIPRRSGRLNIFSVDTTKVFGSVFVRYCIYSNDRTQFRTGAAEVTFTHTGQAVMPLSEHGPDEIGDLSAITLEAFRTGKDLNVFFRNESNSDRYVNYEVSSLRMPNDIAEDAIIQMTITGMAPGQTWMGLPNGVHFLNPDTHVIRKYSTAGSPYWNTEQWVFGAGGNAPTVNSLNVKFRMAASMTNSTGDYVTNLTFVVYNNVGVLGSISAAFSGNNTLSGVGGLLQDRMLSQSGTVSGINFSWQRMRGQRPSLWGNF